MNKCQLLNLTIQRMANAGGRLLPAEYQQVEYLQSVYPAGGTAAYGPRIDTGVGYFADFEVKCEKTDTTPVKYFGVSNDTCVQRYNAANPYYTFYNTSSSYYMSNVNVYSLAVVKWKDNQIYINNNFVTNFTKTNSSGSFTLFGAYQYFGNIRIYYCKLWDTNGQLIRNMIPCYRKSDSVPGFYDLVNNTFYTNSGPGGSFIVGNNV